MRRQLRLILTLKWFTLILKKELAFQWMHQMTWQL